MVFNNIDENDRRTIVRHVDEFCGQCGYLHPGAFGDDPCADGNDPCEGCKMQEFVDSLDKGRQT